MRVVSLLPSATELCYALGVEPVGVSHECDYPPEAKHQPSVIDSRIDADASSDAIDSQVQDAVAEGGVYELDREALRECDPDLIISQGICEVCAVDESLVRTAIDEEDIDATLVASNPQSIDDVLSDLERLGEHLGKSQQARQVREGLETRIEHVKQNTPNPENGPTVTILDWLAPVMVAGHWIPELVEIAGGRYPLAAPGDPSIPHEWRDIRDADPERLIAAPCGFTLEQTRENQTDLAERPGWESLQAVSAGTVYAMDGHHYVNRPGPRLVETLELLAATIHDDHDIATRETPLDAVARWSELTATQQPTQ